MTSCLVTRFTPLCEIMTTAVMPTLRAKIARHLLYDYDVRMKDIAGMIGVSTAAVCFYSGKKRGTNGRALRGFPEVDKAAERMAIALMEGKEDEDIGKMICDLCKQMRKRPAFKGLSR